LNAKALILLPRLHSSSRLNGVHSRSDLRMGGCFMKGGFRV
jgi:hypothetical protein